MVSFTRREAIALAHASGYVQVQSTSLLPHRAMPDRGVAADAVQRLSTLTRTVVDQFADEIAVTGDAVFFQDARVTRLDPDWLVKVLQREAFRVPKTVLGLGQILADQIVRRVAVVASREGMMARLLPTVVLISHDVTIDARRTIWSASI